MSRQFDQAQQLEEAEREACLAKQLAKPGLKATGFCRDPGCRKPLPEGQLFCDAECRDYFEKDQRMKDILGRR